MLFSIIVPVYKVPYDKLKQCIESVYKQTISNYELILVDDGSPDECPKICDEYASESDKTIVVHQKNKGLSGARNGGARIARGEYITFVDGDDFLDRNTLERMMPIILEECPDVISSRHKAASKVEDIGEYPYIDGKVYTSKEELYYLKEMLLCFKGNNHSSCGKFYKRSFLEKNHLEHNEKLRQGAEDLEFNFRVFGLSTTIINLSDGFYNCVYNENSITRSFSEKNAYLVLDCYKSVMENIDLNDTNLVDWYYNRLLHSVIASTISGFFNPNNGYSYKEIISMYNTYLDTDIVQKAIKCGEKKPIDLKRRIVLICMKIHLFFPISMIAKIRFTQKSKAF